MFLIIEGDLVIAVSDAYTIARLLQENYTASSSDEDENNKMNTNNNNNKNKEEKQNGKKVAAQDFVRKNDKYFIRPEGNFILFSLSLSLLINQ